MTIFLADNQDITRAGIQFLAEQTIHGVEFIRTEDKTELVEQLRIHHDAVVVLDYTMFDMNDVEDLQILYDRFDNVQWILFSVDLSQDFVRRVIAMGGRISILLKESSAHEVRECIQYATHGPAHDRDTALSAGSPGGGRRQAHAHRNRDTQRHRHGNDYKGNRREAFLQFPYGEHASQEHIPQIRGEQCARGYEVCAQGRTY